MSLNIRRVVTGHDKNGRATVKIDEVAKNVVSARPGASAAVIWTATSSPKKRFAKFFSIDKLSGS